MASPPVQSLAGCFSRFPGAVLQLSADGTVMESNGRLERELGRELRGRPFSEALDAGSSRGKWNRILELAGRGEEQSGEEAAVVWELIFSGRETLPEPRPFSVLWDDDLQRFWLLEHRPDPRLDELNRQVVEVNSELSNTQRDLVKERGRLAGALEELEEQYDRVERLARTVQEQNEELETRNLALLAMAEELRARGQELERSNQALDEFAHAVSHDLQAPLRSIDNYAAWLAEDLGEALQGESRAHLDRLRNRAGRMQTMIRGVLEYARAARHRSRAEPVDVGELVTSVVELLDPPRQVDIRVDAAMPVVLTGRAPLQQVFQNLIGNAVRYAGGDAPQVHVGVETGAGTAKGTGPGGAERFHEFFVSDNGPGIPEGARERIWSLFRTVEPEERAQGTGIGLAVVKRLVEAHGGRAWVESHPGRGATFRFLWPRATAEDGADERDSPSARAPRAGE